MIAKKNTPSKSKGFSLVELLVLVAIIAILAGLSGLALMKWIPQANLKRAARTIASMCQHAKIEAIKLNKSTSMTCNSTTNTCSILLVSDSTQLRFLDLNNIRGVQVTNTATTTFTNRGRATPANTFIVRNDAGNQLNIVVSPSGGVATRY